MMFQSAKENVKAKKYAVAGRLYRRVSYSLVAVHKHNLSTSCLVLRLDICLPDFSLYNKAVRFGQIHSEV